MSQTRYFMPPEWEKHKLTLLTWPDNRDTWPGERLNRAEHVYADILEVLTVYENVLLIVANDQAQQAAAAMIQNRNIDWNRIRLIRMPVNDVWIRDYGPIGLIKTREGGSDDQSPADVEQSASAGEQKDVADDEQPASIGEQKDVANDEQPVTADEQKDIVDNVKLVMSNWEYNAWGKKYPPFDADNAIPTRLARHLGYPVVSTGMVLEGGSIDVNGTDCVMTTESVLLNPNRNPGLSKRDIEEHLKHYLGIKKVIWLKKGLKGDDTDGHIDDLARFVSNCKIVTSVSEDPGDPNYEALRENLQILKASVDSEGQPFEIITLPLPITRIAGTTVDGSEYVPASYTNFYIGNGCVLVPLYDPAYDEPVMNTFRSLFPDRNVHGIRCNDLVWGQGSIHCVTQQIPMLNPVG